MADVATPGVVLSVQHLVVFQCGDPDDADGTINRQFTKSVCEAVKDHLSDEDITPSEVELHLWVDSPGGDAHSVFKLVLQLRHLCARLVVVVPDHAKSAATLIALGADKLMMAAGAELGPLDAQIEHPNRENEIVSALDVANATKHLALTALSVANLAGASLSRSTMLPRAEVLPHVLQFGACLMRPLMKQLDPTLTHRAETQLKVAESTRFS